MRERKLLPAVLAFGALAVLVTLMALILPDLRPGAPQIPELAPQTGASWDQLPIHQAAELARTETWTALAKSSGSAAAFTPILPVAPPTPTAPAPAPPPPPATVKVELTYQGHLTTSSGAHQAFVLHGDERLVLTNASKVLAYFTVQSIARDVLTLLNPTGAVHTLPFNKKTALEIPAK